MKKKERITIIIICLLTVAGTAQAQSLGDLFSKENLGKVVSGITGTNQKIDITGKWNYTGSAVEFKSENLLKQAGGLAAASIAEGKLNEQLGKVGIRPGQVQFVFNADSTFTSAIGTRTMKGEYSYDALGKQLKLKYLGNLLHMNAKLNYNGEKVEMLFNSDKLLKLIAFLSKQSGKASMKAIGTIADSYDGMLMGLELKKQ